MRRIAIVVFDQLQSLDVFGPVEVFDIANRIAGGDAYSVELVASTAEPISTTSGVRILPDRAMGAVRGSIDTLMIAGGTGVRAATKDAPLVRWVARTSARARRTCSVCTGAFLLAEAGLLDGRRATTHWGSCDELAARYPTVRVDPGPIYIREGAISTSAGVTAGIDLSLALVEEDLGAIVARDVARWLVLFLKRPGGQAQFSAPLDGPVASRPRLREVQEWIATHLEGDLTVPVLAAHAFMSERHFARAFRDELGTTPAAYVERLRVDRARSLLESTDAPIESIADSCGFGTVETFRRAFQRRMGASPGQYRDRFHPRLRTA